MSSRLVSAALVGSVLLLASCGGDDGEQGDAAVDTSAADAAEDVSATAAPADTGSESSAPSEEPAATDAAPVATEAPIAAAGGTCAVSASGAVDVTYTGSQGIGDAASAHWLTPEEIAQAEADFGFSTPALQLACAGPDGESVLLSVPEVERVAYAPGSVLVAANEAGLFTSEAIIGNDEPVELLLSRFDESGIAGSVTFTGTGLGLSEPTTVELTFDFENLTP